MKEQGNQRPTLNVQRPIKKSARSASSAPSAFNSALRLCASAVASGPAAFPDQTRLRLRLRLRLRSRPARQAELPDKTSCSSWPSSLGVFVFNPGPAASHDQAPLIQVDCATNRVTIA